MGSTLIFPSTVQALQSDRSAIRSQLRDTYNRLHSIFEDSQFVDEQVAAAYPDFPVVANQRAGSWYVKPRGETAHAYFKSTDGHAGQHNFNLRRANLGLLPLIKEKGGLVLVDSTRRGKRFPDALSKTVPLWCAVLNSARMKLLPPSPDNSSASLEDWLHNGTLKTLPTAVGRSEHSQMEVRVEEWAQALASSAYDLSALRALDRPLRPIFVSPASVLSHNPASSFTAFIPIVCTSASKLATETDGMERARGFTYVQGSGDDHEAWSKGLNAKAFWENSSKILSASRENIDAVIAELLDSSPPSLARLSLSSSTTATPIRNTRITLEFATTSRPSPFPKTSHVVIEAAKGPISPAAPPADPESTVILAARTGKAGYHPFFNALDPIVEFATKKLRAGETVGVEVAQSEAQSEANDLGAAFVLVLLVLIFDNEGQLKSEEASAELVSKDLIRSRLQWILEVFPTFNPSRAVLNRTNEYLMSRH
ncbi:tRNA A64-2'-O-ribosylphosphate transferase [Leucosporidium creatinivorum]|uniref:tRNA A64-2'-O-ribosylphosphate transferase n=1 Tax=Leucosporidium creatinivorum TaxID=106004 RepID=A0A1Y2ECL5_9BASI|nr:tRNA A64-2'-O-ribosylphosphate transferase [Leucosporidium creatinivorum]